MRGWATSLCFVALATVASGQLRQQEGKRESLRRFSGDEPTWLVPGASVGVWGIQQPVGVTADLHYGPATLRLHPGLWHWGVSLQYYFDPNAATFNPRRRPLFGEVGYMQAWLLGLPDDPGFESRRRLMLLFGQRHPLTPRGDVYFEFAAGMNIRWDNVNGTSNTRYIVPTLECRIGIALLRKRLLPRAGRGLFTPEPRKKRSKR